MKQVIKLSVLCGIVFFAACGNPAEKENVEASIENLPSEIVDVQKLNMVNLIKEIEKREKAYLSTERGDQNKAYALIQAYAAFAERFNNRENADEYLFKAGEIAMGENMTVEAIRHLTSLKDEFPKYGKRAYGLFLLGFVQENQAQNLDEAKRIYEQFLEEFPNHEMADDAKASIANLGKSPEEIIREFEIRDSIAKIQKAA